MGASNTPVLLRLIINAGETFMLENALAIAEEYARSRAEDAAELGDDQSAKVYRHASACYQQLSLTLQRKLEKVEAYNDN